MPLRVHVREHAPCGSGGLLGSRTIHTKGVSDALATLRNQIEVPTASRDHKETAMELQELLAYLDSGGDLVGGTDPCDTMNLYSTRCIELCAELNAGYHTPEQIRAIMSRITGVEVDEGFRLFPPFYSDFGKNIRFGRNVFVNSLCCFQDQGGIRIGDNALIGHRVTFATLNHDLDPQRRHILHCAPIHVGNDVWIGAGATILPGVTIGDGAIVGAAALVNRDVPPCTIVAGVPARVIRTLDRTGSSPKPATEPAADIAAH